jgi:TonB family protein
MTGSLLALYVQFNLLVAAAWFIWVLTKTITRGLKIEISQRGQLVVARFLFIGLLLIVSCALIGSLFSFDWFAGIVARADEYWFTPGITIVAGLDDGLDRRYLLGGTQVNLSLLVSLLLLAGLAWQTYRLTIAVRYLRQIVADATEWKNLHGIQLVFSQQISAPFSTVALGRKQIVLPYSLLGSPRNLRLAVTHELQHLRNGDLVWVILLEGVKLLCFWNPAAHLWQYEFDCLQELACDEVLVQEKQVNALIYGNCLLDVASNNTGHTLVAVSSMVPKLSLLHSNQSQLKRRILMLGKNASNKHTGLKLAGYGLLLGAGILNATLMVFAAEQGAGRNDHIPVSRVNPQYPASALDQKQVGWVHIEFAIDTNGSVQDAVVVENCVWLQTDEPESCTPDPLFDAESLAALRQWRYDPVLENGVAVRVEGVQTILRYELREEEPNAAQQ